jgi:hypothetical protein
MPIGCWVPRLSSLSRVFRLIGEPDTWRENARLSRGVSAVAPDRIPGHPRTSRQCHPPIWTGCSTRSTE